ncbi:hypothetical protein FACS189419_05380 [Planctomycetales bacterium]|nr:hypothetical protein FACS189419_05380 [Planctomycetales bacterium]
MKHFFVLLAGIALIGFIGCDQGTEHTGFPKDGTTTEKKADTKADDHAGHNHADHDHTGHDHAGHSHADHGAKEEVKAAEKAVEKVEEKAKEEVKAVEQKVEKTYKELNADIIAAYKKTRTFDQKNKPKAPIVLPKEFVTPDGLAVNPKTGTLFMSVPNYARRPNDAGAKVSPGVLAKVDVNAGKAETVLELEKVKEIEIADAGIKQIGPMGIAFGPDGNIYVADNQYFFNDKKIKSRILRVLMDGDNPTGKIEVAVDGTNLSNAIYWTKDGNYAYLTDTFFDLPGKHGSGGVWQFKKDEILKAGSGDTPPIKLTPITKGLGDDPHLIAFHEVKKLPGCGNGGPDGLTADKNGVIYYGFFDTGEMHRLVVDADGKVVATDEIHPAGKYYHCCDGIYYDAGTNKVYINDSAANAIHAFTPPDDNKAPVVLETIWENGDTDGADGSLDQPCECVVIGKKMIIVNFDWPFPELLNTASDDPSTLSIIELP